MAETNGVLFIILYVLIGLLVNHFYQKRDLQLSAQIDEQIDEYMFSLYPCDPMIIDLWYYEYKRHEASQQCIDSAGWWYWRRKSVFGNLPIRLKNIISFPFWPIDIFMCEMGYMQEKRFMNNKLRSLKGE